MEQAEAADGGTTNPWLASGAARSVIKVTGSANVIRDFLTTRRARIAPEQAGLAAYGRRRRVPGLRREEVATLAGISVEYYTQLERGRTQGVSDDVLDSLAQALQLDDAERRHLYDLVRATSNTGPNRRRPGDDKIRPTVQRALDAITAPAIIRNRRLDILAANRLGRALYEPIFTSHIGPPNFARFSFLDPEGPTFYGNWDASAADCVGLLRAEAGRNPHDRKLANLVGELSTQSEEFRVRWARHSVKFHRTGSKLLRHPGVGDVTVEGETFELPGDTGQVMVIYTAEPASPSHQALDLLASWTYTPNQTQDEAGFTQR